LQKNVTISAKLPDELLNELDRAANDHAVGRGRPVMF
jgi:metal-responsive CopG/Arc/MetJ family transcriptional regulator